MTTVLKTPLYPVHIQLGGKMVEFAGWEMPLLYTGIIDEHMHTRRAASVFDVSHMGRLEFRGSGAEALLQYVCTRQLADMSPGQSRYSHICHERGGIIDDVIVSRYEDHWFMVCNASNRKIVLAWLEQHRKGREVEITDITESTLMAAIQGPDAVPKLSAMLPLPIAELKRYRFLAGSYMGIPYTIFRSGYTGEDGVEIILPAAAAQFLAPLIAQADEGAEPPFKAAGLGARDTLRLEAAMPLYGHELDDKVDSLSAGLAWAVDLKKEFIGVEPLRRIAQAGPEFKLVGIELQGRRIARQDTPISAGEQVVGKVTSGTFSPTLQKSIAMAYIRHAFAQPGQQITAELGGTPVPGVIVPLPFYKKKA
jgi:aminomethyltransferase